MIAQGLVARLRPRSTPRRSHPYPAPGASRRAHGRRLGRRGRIAVVCGLLLAALLAAGWFLFRDSSLVSASHVTVEGESGPDAGRIRQALQAAAHTMSTLDVDMGRLRSAVAPYPIVKDLDVTTQFPHGMRIYVVEQLAVAAIDLDGRRVPVAPDGTVLHDVVAAHWLPLVPLRVAPGGARVTDANALGAIRLLAVAPDRLRAKLGQVSTVSGHGLVAQLRNGPALYFGDATDLGAKWLAASAVLADAGSAGAAYIDVTDPGRPVAGSGSAAPSAQTATDSSPSTSSDPVGGATATSPTSTAAPAPTTSTSTAPTGG